MSTVRLSDVYSSNGNEVRLPRQGGLVHSTYRRINTQATYGANSPINAMTAYHMPRKIGNTVLVEWNIFAEISSTNSGAYIMVNGNFQNKKEPTGESRANQYNWVNDNYGYFIWNRDGNTDTTPQTAVVLFKTTVKTLEPLRFDIYNDSANIYLNRNFENATGSNSREIGVSTVATYEFTS